MKNGMDQVNAGHRKEIQDEFWSGPLGLTLVTVSLAVFIFLIIPMQRAGLPARLVFDRGWGRPVNVIAFMVVIATAVLLWIAIECPTYLLMGWHGPRHTGWWN